MSKLIKKFKKTLADFSMLSEGARVLICVSGGIDSVVLLDLFSSIKDELDLGVAVCHLNHNLRGKESARDQKFVEKLARGKGFRFFTKTLKEGELSGGDGGVQESARLKRYAFFDEMAKRFGATHIAIAHNRDDQSETVLMRILKGSGLKGLRGIPAVRGAYIRPLIEVTRAGIEEYAKENGIEFVEDSSNDSTKYQRNKLRLDLIPLLEKEYNPAVKDAFVSLSKSSERDYDFIDALARELYAEAKEREGEGTVVFSRAKLNSAHRALSTRVFFMAIERLKGDVREYYSVHVDAFLALLESIEPGASIDLPDGIILRRVYERLIFDNGLSSKTDHSYEVALNTAGVTELGKTGFTFSAEVLDEPLDVMDATDDIALFDMDALYALSKTGAPLIVRCFRAGDRMTPLGMDGVKKIQDIFVDDKVPKFLRVKIPLLLIGDEVLWIAGLRRSERAKLTPKTRRTLRIEIKRERKH